MRVRMSKRYRGETDTDGQPLSIGVSWLLLRGLVLWNGWLRVYSDRLVFTPGLQIGEWPTSVVHTSRTVQLAHSWIFPFGHLIVLEGQDGHRCRVGYPGLWTGGDKWMRLLQMLDEHGYVVA
jgi:hypothetical protein